MTQFEQDLIQSKKIESLFRKHPKFPFLNLGTDVEENTLLYLFWLYMVKPYTTAFGKADWKNLWGYVSFREPNEEAGGNGGGVSFYDNISKRLFEISPVNYHADQYKSDHFVVSTGHEDFLAAATECENNMLYDFGMGIDLRHPSALEKAREFMHAFFIEKLSLEQMEKKIELFDQFEGHQFKRKK